MLGFHTILSVAGGLKRIPNAEALCDTARKALADLAATRARVTTAGEQAVS